MSIRHQMSCSMRINLQALLLTLRPLTAGSHYAVVLAALCIWDINRMCKGH